jgi:hypothetical protein
MRNLKCFIAISVLSGLFHAFAHSWTAVQLRMVQVVKAADAAPVGAMAAATMTADTPSATNAFAALAP